MQCRRLALSSASGDSLTLSSQENSNQEDNSQDNSPKCPNSGSSSKECITSYLTLCIEYGQERTELKTLNEEPFMKTKGRDVNAKALQSFQDALLPTVRAPAHNPEPRSSNSSLKLRTKRQFLLQEHPVPLAGQRTAPWNSSR